MADRTERDGVTKLPKFIGPVDFINWHCPVKAYLKQQVIGLIGLTDRPYSKPAKQHRRWLEANLNPKSAITLTLPVGPLAQMTTITDDDD